MKGLVSLQHKSTFGTEFYSKTGPLEWALRTSAEDHLFDMSKRMSVWNDVDGVCQFIAFVLLIIATRQHLKNSVCGGLGVLPSHRTCGHLP